MARGFVWKPKTISKGVKTPPKQLQMATPAAAPMAEKVVKRRRIELAVPSPATPPEAEKKRNSAADDLYDFVVHLMTRFLSLCNVRFNSWDFSKSESIVHITGKPGEAPVARAEIRGIADDSLADLPFRCFSLHRAQSHGYRQFFIEVTRITPIGGTRKAKDMNKVSAFDPMETRIV